MSHIVAFRSLNRSQKARVGGKQLSSTGNAFLNLDNPRVTRDLGRHGAVGGAVVPVGASFYQGDDGVVDAGGTVTVRATGLVLDVAAVNFTKADGSKGSGAAGTATVGAADVTNPRIDTIAVNTGTGAFVVIAGTATAGAQLSTPTALGQSAAPASVFLGGRGTVPAARIVLAYVLVPANATNLSQANVIDVRP